MLALSTHASSPCASTTRHRRAVVAMLLAAAAVLTPGAAVAAPTVIDAPYSAPVSLLHGDTTAPRPDAGAADAAVTDDRALRRRRRHRLRSRRLQLRLVRSVRHHGAAALVLLSGAPPRAGPARSAWTRGPPSCGPPTNHLRIDLHDRAVRPRPAVVGSHGPGRARCVAERPTGRVPHRAAQRTLRRGAGTAPGALRDTEGRTCTENRCRCTSRRTTE
jgi:hypothetical protein